MEKTLSIDLNTKPTSNSHNEALPYDVLIQEFNKVKSEKENLSHILAILRKQYEDLKRKQSDDDDQQSQKRKRDETDGFCNNSFVHCCSCSDECSPGRPKEIKSNVSRVHVRIDPSDTTLVVKDGYNWRKYGQKVTRDNPSPRAYYKCSFAPACPVKKKVQRSAEDPSILVATYEGQHSHHSPSRPEISVILPAGAATAADTSPCSTQCCLGSVASPDLDDPAISCDRIQSVISATKNSAVSQRMFVEQMASSLTRNHSFTNALVAAITGRILDDASDQDNEDSLSYSKVLSN